MRAAKYQILTPEGWEDSDYRQPITFHHWEDWGGIHDVPCDEHGKPISLLQGDDERWVEMTSDESE